MLACKASLETWTLARRGRGEIGKCPNEHADHVHWLLCWRRRIEATPPARDSFRKHPGQDFVRLFVAQRVVKNQPGIIQARFEQLEAYVRTQGEQHFHHPDCEAQKLFVILLLLFSGIAQQNSLAFPAEKLVEGGCEVLHLSLPEFIDVGKGRHERTDQRGIHILTLPYANLDVTS